MKSSMAGRDRQRRFETVVGAFHQDMYRYALWLCRDRSVAEDVVQEALLRAWRSLDGLREDTAARSWLLTIVRRENARWFERQRPETVDVDALTPAQAAEIAEAPDEHVRELRAAIFALEDGYREPLVLQVLMGYSTREIADLMGLNQGAVLTRLHRARLKLRDTLGEAEPPGGTAPTAGGMA
jgi:RNA polymerase sigma-70 factor (ECF subfamily)